MTAKLRINKKIIRWILLGVFICSLLWLYHKHVLKNFFVQSKEQAHIAQGKRDQLQKHKKTLDQRSIYQQQFEELSQKIQAQLPEAREEGQFLTEISRVANQNYVHIESMNPRPYTDLGDFKEISVEIKMEANLGNLVRFLHQMRESSVLLEASRLRLQPKSERSALLKGHLIISTIFLKKNET